MDEELRAYLDEIDRRAVARSEALMRQLNDQYEKLLNTITALRRDFTNTKGFLIEDALVLGERLNAVERRLDRLEEPPHE